MTPLIFTFVVFGSSILAGLFGSLFGLGGGFIVIPILTMVFHIDIRYAIGASIVSVIATSSGAAAAYVRERMANMRVAMVLEIATVSGALTGAYITQYLHPRWLYVMFGLILAYSAVVMLRHRKSVKTAPPPDAIADKLRLHDSYYDASEGRVIEYRVTRTKLGFGLMYIAGVVSGLLGIGSGSLKVPAMDLGMQLPIKVSTATSNFMIGVTAAASAAVYYLRGDIVPFIAGPVAAGVLLGAVIGSKLLGRLDATLIRRVFVVVLLYVSASMLWKGWTGR